MNDGGPFFPCELTFHDTVDVQIDDPEATAFGNIVTQTKIRKENVSGISIRDWLAGMALQGFIGAHSGKLHLPTESDAAHWAYAYADAMLEERAKAK